MAQYFVLAVATMKRTTGAFDGLVMDTKEHEYSYVLTTNAQDAREVYELARSNAEIMDIFKQAFYNFGATNDPYVFIRSMARLTDLDE